MNGKQPLRLANSLLAVAFVCFLGSCNRYRLPDIGLSEAGHPLGGSSDGKYAIVHDDIETLDKNTSVRWNMVTSADVELRDKQAVLTYDGKLLYLNVRCRPILPGHSR
jgi:hypothetical protein